MRTSSTEIVTDVAMTATTMMMMTTRSRLLNGRISGVAAAAACSTRETRVVTMAFPVPREDRWPEIERKKMKKKKKKKKKKQTRSEYRRVHW
jgi:hypothetical protein